MHNYAKILFSKIYVNCDFLKEPNKIELPNSNNKRKRISIPTKTQSKFTKLHTHNDIHINTCSLFGFFFRIQ